MTREEFIKKYENKLYIGDSVYAHFDGYHIILETINDNYPSNVIGLEPEVINKLFAYRNQLYKEDKEAEEIEDIK